MLPNARALEKELFWLDPKNFPAATPQITNTTVQAAVQVNEAPRARGRDMVDLLNAAMRRFVEMKQGAIETVAKPAEGAA
jgi:hypothetical protein